MGIVIGKFQRKKTTLQVLEKLESEIKSIEEFKRDTELTHKKIVGRFIILSFGIYLIIAFVLCYYWLPPTLSEKIKYIGPLIIIPFLLFSVKKVLAWYYNRKLHKNQSKLKSLKDEKKKILDKVMETETYKVAKGILEKFAPEQVRKTTFSIATGNDLTPSKSLSTPNPSGLRLRNVPQMSQGNRSLYLGNSLSTINNTPTPQTQNLQTPHNMVLQTTSNAGLASVTPVPLPRSILPRNRSVLDKMVEYIIGDGPSNRYALICKNCDGHNGMALKEEFEYMSFRCCYCYTLNPARKKRPVAPKLEFETAPVAAIKHNSDTSDSERISDSESDSEYEVEAISKVTTIFNSVENKLPQSNNDLTNEVNTDLLMEVDSKENIKCDDIVESSNSTAFDELAHEKIQENEEKFT